MEYGLSGALHALQGGYDASRGDVMNIMGRMGGGGGGNATAPIGAYADRAVGQYQQGIDGLGGFVDQGRDAHQLQAALSGALGSGAQQTAYNNFNSSPGQTWLRDQAEQSLMRNSAATGGLGGGNVLQALQQQAVGLAQQDFQNHWNRLGNVSDRGLNAGNAIGNLHAGAGNALSAAGGQEAGLAAANASANASMYGSRMGAMSNMAGLLAGLGMDAGKTGAHYAYDAGNVISRNNAALGSGLGSLINEQGQGLSNILGNERGTIANLLAGAGNADYESSRALAALLSGNNMNTAAIYGGVNAIPGTQQNSGMLGNIGNLASGIGGMAKGFGWGD